MRKTELTKEENKTYKYLFNGLYNSDINTLSFDVKTFYHNGFYLKYYPIIKKDFNTK